MKALSDKYNVEEVLEELYKEGLIKKFNSYYEL
jgi:hypothetical protein